MKHFTNRRKIKKLLIKKHRLVNPIYVDPTGIRRHVMKKLRGGSYYIIPKRSPIIRANIGISKITNHDDYYFILLIPRGKV